MPSKGKHWVSEWSLLPFSGNDLLSCVDDTSFISSSHFLSRYFDDFPSRQRFRCCSTSAFLLPLFSFLYYIYIYIVDEKGNLCFFIRNYFFSSKFLLNNICYMRILFLLRIKIFSFYFASNFHHKKEQKIKLRTKKIILYLLFNFFF